MRPRRSDRATLPPCSPGRTKSGGCSPSIGTICMSKRSPSTSAAGAAPTVTRSAVARIAEILRTKVSVPLLLELHDPHDTALGQMLGAGRQLVKSDVERLHGVAARAEGQPLPLQPLERLLDLGIHAPGHEGPERRAVDHELDGFDVLPAADALDVVL